MACSIPPSSIRCRTLTPAASIFAGASATLHRHAGGTLPALRAVLNYTRYVDEFVSWGCSQILDPDSPYIALSCAGGIWITAETEAPEQAISDLAWKKHQMPAWHLITHDGKGSP